MKIIKNKRIKHLEKLCQEILYDKEYYYDKDFHDFKKIDNNDINKQDDFLIFGKCSYKGTHNIKPIGSKYIGMSTALEFDMYYENFTTSYSVYIDEHLLFTSIRCGSNSGRPSYSNMFVLDIDETQKFFNYLKPKIKTHFEMHDMLLNKCY